MIKLDAIVNLLNGERVRKKDWAAGEFIYLNNNGDAVDQKGQPAEKSCDMLDLYQDGWELFSGPSICKFSELYDQLQPGDHATYDNGLTKVTLDPPDESGKKRLYISHYGKHAILSGSIALEEIQATWTIHRGGQE